MITVLQLDRKVIGIMTASLCLSLCPLANAGPPTGEALLQSLRANDAALFDGFTLSMSMRTPPGHSRLDDERAEEHCTITGNPATRGLTKRGTYAQRPRYHAVGSAGYDAMDYDTDGNLYVWRPVRTAVLKTLGLNDVYSRQLMTVLSSEGDVIKEEAYETLARYRPSGKDSLYEFDRILLVAGRAFSQHLTAITDVTEMPDGIIKVTAAGSYGSGMKGTWELTVDPVAENMVRSATFTYQGTLLFASASSGTIWFAGFAIPETGSLTYYLPGDREFRVDIHFERFQKGLDGALVDTLKSRVTSDLPPQSEIIDYRPDPKRPRRITVGE